MALTVSGNQLLAGGQPVQLHGVNRSGTEYMCSGNSASSFDGPTDQASVDAMRAWKVNAVRVPLNEDCWLGINGIPQAMSAAQYRTEITGWVNLLMANGLYVILDLHWAAPGTQQSTSAPPMPDMDHAPAFWTSVASTFKANNDKVLFDLFNEPNNVDWTCLRDGVCPTLNYPVAGMQTLVNAVRSTNAQNVVMTAGLSYTNDLTQWLAYKPRDAYTIASWHSYNFNACITQACWDSQIAPVIAAVPVVTGEMGENDCASGYVTGLMNWLDTHNASYLAWAWDTYSCTGFPALVTAYDGSPTNYGIGVRSHYLLRP